MLEERDYDFTAQTWQPSRQFIYGGQGIDDVVIFENYDTTAQEWDSHYYSKGLNDRVLALTDGNGVPVEHYLYDPYGKATFLDGSRQPIANRATANPYLFQSRRLDEESGLYYFRNRYYSPDLGRFLQRDPLGYVDGMNLYEFVGGRPVVMRDPFGLSRDVSNLIGHAIRKVADHANIDEETGIGYGTTCKDKAIAQARKDFRVFARKIKLRDIRVGLTRKTAEVAKEIISRTPLAPYLATLELTLELMQGEFNASDIAGWLADRALAVGEVRDSIKTAYDVTGAINSAARALSSGSAPLISTAATNHSWKADEYRYDLFAAWNPMKDTFDSYISRRISRSAKVSSTGTGKLLNYTVWFNTKLPLRITRGRYSVGHLDSSIEIRPTRFECCE